MSLLLNPRFLIGLALTFVLAFTHFTAFRTGKAATQAKWETERAEQTAQALAASEAARNKERELQTTVTKVSDDYQNEKRKRIADAQLNAGKLSELQAALTDSASLNPTATDGTDDPRGAIISECAVALVGLDGYAKGLAAKTSALQAYAREVCVTTK